MALGLLLMASAVAVPFPLAAQAPSPYRPDVPGSGDRADYAYELETTVEDGFTIAAVGDLIMAWPPEVGDPSNAGLIDVIRAADVAYANFEAHVLDMRTLPVERNGGFVGEPEVATAVRNMGFDVVGRSNNHSGDFGPGGLLTSDSIIRAAGLVSVGSGPDYRWARAPGYFMTPKGRTAFIVASSSFGRNPVSADDPTRGGSNPLRVTRCTVVPAARLAEFRDRSDCVRAGDVDKPTWSYAMDQGDLEAILGSIREAKMRSDFLAVGIHAHQTVYEDTPVTRYGNSGAVFDPTVADFLREYAHATIDAGADAFFGTGPHILRGIEIYRGRPVFYGLGEFFRQMGIIGLPGSEPTRGSGTLYDPIRYEHVMAVSTFAGGEVSEIRLYPIDLGWADRFSTRGVPRSPTPEVARRILERLQDLSAPFGTEISIEGEIGVIRPG